MKRMFWILVALLVAGYEQSQGMEPTRIESADGDLRMFTMDQSGTFERDTYNTLTSDSSIAEAEAATVPSNQIWYMNDSTTEVTTPSTPDVFGANIVSNTYDADKGCWVITFDGDVTSIGFAAFANCSSLTSVTIPDSATSIGGCAFENCTGLTSISIPDRVTSIDLFAFQACTGLKSVMIGKSVRCICECTFLDCTNLTDLYLTDLEAWCNCRLDTPASHLFGSSTATVRNLYLGNELVTELVIPDSVTSIGYAAFYNCSSLTSVTIPDSVTSISERAFSNCNNLTSFYGKFASSDHRCLIVDGRLIAFAPAGCNSYTIPDSVMSIDYSALSHYTSLTSVTIPDSVTSIDHTAFYGCSNLTSFYGKFASSDHRCLIVDGHLIAFAPADCNSYTIPDSVTSIDEHTFRDCTELTRVTIPDSVTYIGYEAFYGCTGLTQVYCKSTTPPELEDSDTFDRNGQGYKIYVPASDDDSIIKAYRSAASWRDHASSIEEYDFSAAK